MFKYITVLLLFLMQSIGVFAQQHKGVNQCHELMITVGVGLDLDQVSSGFMYYTHLKNQHQIGIGLEYSSFSYNFNVTNQSVMEAYSNLNNSSIWRLRPTQAFYVEIPLMYAQNIFLNWGIVKLEGGVTNSIFVGTRGTATLVQVNGSRSINHHKWIAPYGFKNYMLRSNIATTYFLKFGLGFKLQIGIPIIKMGQSADQIPTGEVLFVDNVGQPTSITLYALYKFRKRNKSK